jgi:hypothetical protein
MFHIRFYIFNANQISNQGAFEYFDAYLMKGTGNYAKLRHQEALIFLVLPHKTAGWLNPLEENSNCVAKGSRGQTPT